VAIQLLMLLLMEGTRVDPLHRRLVRRLSALLEQKSGPVDLQEQQHQNQNPSCS
jgi:hypothetical protein